MICACPRIFPKKGGAITLKNRTIPYGYVFENGKTVIHADESGIVSEIFRNYVAGKPLSGIANELNARRVEYRPGVIGWDTRVKELLSQLITDGVIVAEGANKNRTYRLREKI